MSTVKAMPREYLYKDKDLVLTDILGSTPSQVLKMYANVYPELINATIKGPFIRNDKQIYEFHTNAGTNG